MQRKVDHALINLLFLLLILPPSQISFIFREQFFKIHVQGSHFPATGWYLSASHVSLNKDQHLVLQRPVKCSSCLLVHLQALVSITNLLKDPGATVPEFVPLGKGQSFSLVSSHTLSAEFKSKGRPKWF